MGFRRHTILKCRSFGGSKKAGSAVAVRNNGWRLITNKSGFAQHVLGKLDRRPATLRLESRLARLNHIDQRSALFGELNESWTTG
jgi:hypothetical protein